jgi:hypothetical protein
MAGSAAGTMSMMRYLGSIAGAGLLAGVLDTGSDAVPEIAVFRIVAAVVVIMAGLAVVAATGLHTFPGTPSSGGQRHPESGTRPEPRASRS